MAVFVMLLAGGMLVVVRTLVNPRAWGGIIILGVLWLICRARDDGHQEPPAVETAPSVPEAVMTCLSDDCGIRAATTAKLICRHGEVWKASEEAGADVAETGDQMLIAEGKYLGSWAYGPDAPWGGWQPDR